MWVQVVLAYMLDLIIGDPAWSIHPVRVIGTLIEKLELFLYRPNASRFQGRILGILLVVLTCVLSYGSVHLIIVLAKEVNPWLGLFVSVLLIYSTFAIKDLKKCAKDIARALRDNQLEKARYHVAQIVGRDTHKLTQEEVTRASVESIAENTVDGIVAPIFYAFVGGAPLAFLYRTINTMDSMIGYKNARYIDFGWGAAKLDDIFNFIPARINAILVPLASLFIGKNSKRSLITIIRDGSKHASPNSGIAEAAFAGALGVQLGGECSYEGIPHHKPRLGDALTPPRVSHIYSSVNLSLACSAMMVALGSLANLIIRTL